MLVVAMAVSLLYHVVAVVAGMARMVVVVVVVVSVVAAVVVGVVATLATGSRQRCGHGVVHQKTASSIKSMTMTAGNHTGVRVVHLAGVAVMIALLVLADALDLSVNVARIVVGQLVKVAAHLVKLAGCHVMHVVLPLDQVVLQVVVHQL